MEIFVETSMEMRNPTPYTLTICGRVFTMSGDDMIDLVREITEAVREREVLEEILE